MIRIPGEKSGRVQGFGHGSIFLLLPALLALWTLAGFGVLRAEFLSPDPLSDNSAWIPDNLVFPGQKNVYFPIMARHTEPLQGFQLAGTFDPNVLRLEEINFLGTACAAIFSDPDFFSPSISNEPDGAYFVVVVIFEIIPPIDHKTLPPSISQRIVNLVFSCREDAQPGGTTVVALGNGVGPKATDNVFAGETAIYPVLASSSTEITIPSGVFKRGDVDRNGVLNIADALSVLSYLFLGGLSPHCLDAADTDDSGKVDIVDPIMLLAFLFLGQKSPAIPFPNYGLDPTPDIYPPCEP